MTMPAQTVTEAGLMAKTASAARSIGRAAATGVLKMWYATRGPDTPVWAKRAIYGALAYFILPLDAVPDFLPLIGFTDDLAILSAALLTVAMHIGPAQSARAEAQIKAWLD